jgi:hypothetical protein
MIAEKDIDSNERIAKMQTMTKIASDQIKKSPLQSDIVSGMQ